jgi:hypothetical protein
MPKTYRVAVIGRTGKGDYGLDVADQTDASARVRFPR